MDNPIVRRMDVLRERWNGFRSQSEAALLLWTCDAENWRMVQAFLEMENSDAGVVPDLFLELRSPFRSPETYGVDLRGELVAGFDANRADLEREGLQRGWAPPPPGSADGDLGVLLPACHSLREAYEDLMDNLVLVLLPEEIGDPLGWRDWIHRLARASTPRGVRFLVLDPAASPLLDGISALEPGRIVSEPVDLEMPWALEELSWDGDPGVPGVLFRRQFVALANAVRSRDLDEARGAARTCRAIATEHGWLGQAVAVDMALAGGLLAAGRTAEAIDVYREAQEFASRIVRDEAEDGKGAAVGVKLLAQARMAQASVHLGAEEHAEAARIYHETALLDGLDDELFLRLENWRMAAVCYERVKDVERSWACGWRALDVGAALDAEGRASSSLPYVGALLRSLSEGPENDLQSAAVDERMTGLLGPDWMPDEAAAP